MSWLAPNLRRLTADAVGASGDFRYGDMLLVDATAGNVNLTLPRAAVGLPGLTVKKLDATGNTVTLTCTGGDTIDGAATYVISAQYGTVNILAGHGTAYVGGPGGFHATWHIVSKF